MQTTFSQKKISGILGILPENSYSFEDETTNFPPTRAKRLKKVMGYGQRRRAKINTTSSDLCISGLKYLFDNEKLKPDDIGAIIVVTLTPDYFIPHISNIIHGVFDLDNKVICLDIAQACTGYILGLFEAFMLLEHIGSKKVVLCTADILHRKEKENETFDAPPFGGDAATISIIENYHPGRKIYVDIRNYGNERNTLIYPGGAFRFPQGTQISNPIDIGDGVPRNPYTLNMDGSAVFNFAQREVPGMIDDLLSYSELNRDIIDWFFFHQPNKFMLEKLAEKAQIPQDKMYMDLVEKYGNSNSSTIPLVIADHMSNLLTNNECTCCLVGFGGGLSLGGIVTPIGNMEFCNIIESNL